MLAKCLMHMAHLSGKTSGVSKSSSDWLNYTGFTGDVCIAFFNVPPENKDAVAPNPLTKEESRCVYKCDGEHFSGSTKRWSFFSKACEIFKVCGIKSLKYILEFHTLVCYCGDISTPQTWCWKWVTSNTWPPFVYTFMFWVQICF